MAHTRNSVLVHHDEMTQNPSPSFELCNARHRKLHTVIRFLCWRWRQNFVSPSSTEKNRSLNTNGMTWSARPSRAFRANFIAPDCFRTSRPTVELQNGDANLMWRWYVDFGKWWINCCHSQVQGFPHMRSRLSDESHINNLSDDRGFILRDLRTIMVCVENQGQAVSPELTPYKKFWRTNKRQHIDT